MKGFQSDGNYNGWKTVMQKKEKYEKNDTKKKSYMSTRDRYKIWENAHEMGVKPPTRRWALPMVEEAAMIC